MWIRRQGELGEGLYYVDSVFIVSEVFIAARKDKEITYLGKYDSLRALEVLNKIQAKLSNPIARFFNPVYNMPDK